MLTQAYLLRSLVSNYISYHLKVKNYEEYGLYGEYGCNLKTYYDKLFGKLTAKGLLLESKKERDIIGDMKLKFVDLSDFFKDNYYLFNFRHSHLANIILSFSLIFPMSSYHSYTEVTCGFLNTVFIYFGLTNNDAQKRDRKK